MRRFKIVGLCLVAVFALSAIASATASAELPEVVQCVKAAKVGKKYTGHYNDKKCTSKDEAGEGKYELEPWNLGSKTEKTGKGGKLKKFKGKSGTAFLEVVGLGPVTCSKGADEGEFTGPKTVGNINVTFTGCELNKIKCESEGAKVGEIKTTTLKGEIGYFDERFETAVTKGVAIKLSAQSGVLLAEHVSCGSILFQVKASVIGEVEPPYNTFTKEVKLKFQQSSGHQAIRRLEGEPIPEEEIEHVGAPTETGSILCTELWGGSGWNGCLQSAQSGEATNKGEELELKA
jgi:hypothetical protein